MNIRILSPVVLSFAICSALFAKDAPAILQLKDGSNKKVLIIDHKKGVITHHTSAKDLNHQTTKDAQLAGVYFIKPASFTAAMNLYNTRQYKEAKSEFAKCESEYKSVQGLKGNYSTLAGYYKLECSRQQLSFSTLGKDQKAFNKQPLTRKSHLDQLALNTLWSAVDAQDWAKVATITEEWSQKELSNSKRVQVSYCQALVLENLAKKDRTKLAEAVEAYHRVMIEDHTLSIGLTTSAAAKIFDIYLKDRDVKDAMKQWGSKDENKLSSGYSKLIEAGALAKTYDLGGFGNYKPLSADHSRFLKFQPTKAAQ